MIGLIPFVSNDYLLSAIYIFIILIAFLIKREKNDSLFFVLGFVLMIIFEYFFISTGVETFTRNTLLNVMPIWLPISWAYGFVAIKRTVRILDSYA